MQIGPVFAYFYYNYMTCEQESEPIGGQALELVETVSDLISQTLQLGEDDNESVSFSKLGDTISKH